MRGRTNRLLESNMQKGASLMRAIKLFLLTVAVVCTSVSAGRAQSGVRWQTDLEQAKQVAARSNRLVLLHFWAVWCGPCQQLEKTVFNDPQVGHALEANYVPVKINTDHFPKTAQHYNVRGIPYDVIIKPNGEVVSKTASPKTPEAYVGQMNQIAAANRSSGGTMLASQPSSGGGSATRPTTAVVDRWGQPAAASPDATPSYGGGGYAQNSPYDQIGNGPAQPSPEYGRQPTPQQPPAYDPTRRSAGNQSWVAGPSRPGDAQPGTAHNDQFNRRPDGDRIGDREPMPRDDRFSQGGPHGGQPAWERGRDAYADQVPVNVRPGGQNPALPPEGPMRPNVAATQGPPQNPPLALDGYCTVSLEEQQKIHPKQRRWVLGDKRWGAIHEGRTYLFAGPQEQRKFLEDPYRYAPVLNGNDPVLALDRGQMVAGRREHGVYFNGQIHLFSSEDTLRHFEQNPHRYTGEALRSVHQRQRQWQ